MTVHVSCVSARCVWCVVVAPQLRGDGRLKAAYSHPQSCFTTATVRAPQARMQAAAALTMENEGLLRGTPGWGHYSVGEAEAAERAKADLEAALTEAAGSEAMDRAITAYANCGVVDQAYLKDAQAQLEVQLGKEKAADDVLAAEVGRAVKGPRSATSPTMLQHCPRLITALRVWQETNVTALEAEFDGGAQLDPEVRRRRSGIAQALCGLRLAINAVNARTFVRGSRHFTPFSSREHAADSWGNRGCFQAADGKLAGQAALKAARAGRAVLAEREDIRVAGEEAIRLAAGKSLDMAFAQTVRWLFAPTDPDRSRTPAATRRTRSDRRLQARKNAPVHWKSLRSKLKDGKLKPYSSGFRATGWAKAGGHTQAATNYMGYVSSRYPKEHPGPVDWDALALANTPPLHPLDGHPDAPFATLLRMPLPSVVHEEAERVGRRSSEGPGVLARLRVEALPGREHIADAAAHLSTTGKILAFKPFKLPPIGSRSATPADEIADQPRAAASSPARQRQQAEAARQAEVARLRQQRGAEEEDTVQQLADRPGAEAYRRVPTGLHGTNFFADQDGHATFQQMFQRLDDRSDPTG